MKKLLLFFFLLNVLNCKTSQELSSPLSIQNQHWRTSFDSGLLLDAYYTETAGLFINDKMYQGRSAINSVMTKLKGEINGIRFIGPIKQVEHDSLHFFDIGLFEDKNKKNHAYLIAWNRINGTWQKELEVINAFDKNTKLPEMEIAEARQLWEKLSNSHDHKALIQEVYTSDAIYFNRGKIDEGTEAITKRYAYMANPNWQITLTPIQLLAVQEGLIYEVGKYKSNGLGHYVIIWTKTADNKWKARFDFNF